MNARSREGTLKILDQQDIGTCQKSIKVEVPRDEVSNQMEDVYKEFMTHATVPGFRKGKVPRHIVKMKYGKHVEGEAISKAVENSYKEALKELDLHAVSQPEVTDLEKDDESQPITYTAKFEYIPDIELAEYRDIRPEQPPSEVPEKEVVDTLNRLRDQNATQMTVDDRPVNQGDFVTISSQAEIDGEPFQEATHDELPVELGTGRYIPGFEDELVGLGIGDEKTFSLTLPEDYPQEEKRGKEAKFHVKVKSIQEKQLPELDDEFAKDMGDFETLDDLKERIRESLKINLENQKHQQMRESIRDELLKRNTFDVPPSMVEARYNFINALQDMEYRRYGQSLESMAQQDPNLLTQNEEAAEREVRLTVILEKIAEQENIEATDEDYTRYIVQMAQSAGADPGMYLERIQQQGMESYYRRVTLEEKTLNFLLSKAIEDQGGTTDNASEEQPVDDAATEDESTSEEN
ncbi:trigger factor [bacterium]|nr:trigger factor [bacterium]